jgi:hypothetical protein
MEKKSKLEIAVSYVTLIVAGLWALLGFEYNIRKDTFDKETKKYSLVTEVIQKCTSTDQNDQRNTQQFFALYSNGLLDPGPIVEIFGGIDEFKKLNSACNTLVSNQQAGQKLVQAPANPTVADVQEAAAIPPAAEPLPDLPGTTPSAPPNNGQRFWIYLGTRTNGKWLTKYINIADSFDPAKFSVATDPKRGVYKTIGTLNVRYGSFSLAGDFPPPTSHPLSAGQELQLKSTADWFDSGNWWATIDPPR